MCLTLNHHGTIICSFNYPLLPKLQKKLNQPRNEKSSILLTTERKPSNPNWIEIKNREERRNRKFLVIEWKLEFWWAEYNLYCIRGIFLKICTDLSTIGWTKR